MSRSAVPAICCLSPFHAPVSAGIPLSFPVGIDATRDGQFLRMFDKIDYPGLNLSPRKTEGKAPFGLYIFRFYLVIFNYVFGIFL